MQRKAKIPIQRIFETLIVFRSSITNDRGLIKSPSDKIWKEISNTFGIGNISPKYLYTICKMNRGNILSKLNILQSTETTYLNNDPVPCEIDSESDACVTDKSLNFNITLSSEEWKQIHPITRTYHCGDRTQRNYQVFSNSEWTNIFAVHFWEQTKLSCPINFKRHHIFPETLSCFLKISGYCNECSSALEITADKEPLEENTRIVLQCVLKGNFDTCSSKKKRQLKGKRRSDVVSKILTERLNPSSFRQMEARKLMTFGSKEPAELPSGSVLRTAVSMEKRSKRFNDDPVVAIAIMKTLSKYQAVIKDIGYDPFYVHYWSPLEMAVYKYYVKDTIEPIISIDATGGVVKPPILTSNPTKKRVFLYSIVIQDSDLGIQCSVAHMLSAKHDNDSISYWLCRWRRDGAPLPKVIVTDQSLALIYAVVRVFTHLSSLQQYLDCCYIAVTENKREVLPQCYIRIDVAHILKLFSTWKPIKNSPKRVKDFYLLCLAQVITARSYSDVLVLLEYMFNVMFSETEGLDVNTQLPTTSERSKFFLRNKIEGTGEEFLTLLTSSDQPDSQSNEYVDNDSNEFNMNTEDGVVGNGFYNQVVAIAKRSSEVVKDEPGDHDNLQYLPSLGDMLVKQCKYLPLWSNIMITHFNVRNRNASSSGSESAFNQLKNRVFSAEKLPMRIDEFVEKHIDSIDGSLTLTAAKINSNVRGESTFENNVECGTTTNCTREDHSTEKECTTNMTSVGDEIDEVTDLRYIDSLTNDINVCEQEEILDLTNRNTAAYIVSKQTPMEYAKENWRKKPIQIKKKSKYLHGRMDMDSNFDQVQMLKNANLMEPLQFGKSRFRIADSCGLDSVLQLLACHYVDNVQFKNWVRSQLSMDKTNFWNLLVNLVQKGSAMTTYRKRTLLVKSKVSVAEEIGIPGGKVFQINLASTVKSIMRNVIPEAISLTTEIDCKACKYTQKEDLSVLGVRVNKLNGKYNVENDIKEKLSDLLNESCPCFQTNRILSLPTPLVFIEVIENLDLEEIEKNPLKTMVNPILKLKTSQIPSSVNMFNERFQLVGAIVFQGTDNNKSIGHYFSIVKRGKSFEIYDDLRSKVSMANQYQVYNVEMLIYSKFRNEDK